MNSQVSQTKSENEEMSGNTPVEENDDTSSKSNDTNVPLLLTLFPAFIFGFVFIFRAKGISTDGGYRWVLFDDAMISMSYARTFAETGELVWFPGADRVEGITNPLWTMFFAFLHWAGLSTNQIMLTVMFTGLAFVLAVSWGAYRIAKHLTSSETAALTSAFVVSFTYSLIYWSLRGMEVGAIALCATGLILLAVNATNSKNTPSRKRFILAGLVAVPAVGVLLRFDFLVIAAVTSLWLLGITAKKEGLSFKSFFFAGLPGIGAMAAAGSLTVFRVVYYDTLMPNTYTLKMTNVSLWDRVVRGVDTDIKLIAFLACVIIGGFIILKFHRGSFINHSVVWLLGGVTAATVAYSTYVGGDAWEFFPNRYVIPGLVTGSIVASVGLVKFFSYLLSSGVSASEGFTTASTVKKVTAAALTSFLLLLATSGPGYIDWVRHRGLYVYGDNVLTDWTLALREVLSDEAVFAVTSAGATQYFSRLPAVDLLGKSDVVVASSVPKKEFLPGHDRWDYEHSIIKLRPDVVANLAGATQEDWERMIEAGYTPHCLIFVGQGTPAVKELLVLEGSPHVNVYEGGPLQRCEFARPERDWGRYLSQ